MSKKFFDYGKSFSRMGMAVVAALALTAGFASCGDDDDEGESFQIGGNDVFMSGGYSLFL